MKVLTTHTHTHTHTHTVVTVQGDGYVSYGGHHLHIYVSIRPIVHFKLNMMDFPGGPEVKNPPANSRYTDLIPAAGGSHVPQCS